MNTISNFPKVCFPNMRRGKENYMVMVYVHRTETVMHPNFLKMIHHECQINQITKQQSLTCNLWKYTRVIVKCRRNKENWGYVCTMWKFSLFSFNRCCVYRLVRSRKSWNSVEEILLKRPLTIGKLSGTHVNFSLVPNLNFRIECHLTVIGCF